ncbi:hypothetical protein L4D00_23045 [Photobacterium swingsii]|uniref:hypothetical protein n=1 Tax=Photobacterium swingsii TaxID=680026 RepID=UPI003D0E035F
MMEVKGSMSPKVVSNHIDDLIKEVQAVSQQKQQAEKAVSNVTSYVGSINEMLGKNKASHELFLADKALPQIAKSIGSNLMSKDMADTYHASHPDTHAIHQRINADFCALSKQLLKGHQAYAESHRALAEKEAQMEAEKKELEIAAAEASQAAKLKRNATMKKLFCTALFMAAVAAFISKQVG